MPQAWQIVQARALQTQGVWALSPAFTIGTETQATHNAMTGDVQGLAFDTETRKNTLDAKDGVLGTEYGYFQGMNTAIAARFDSEVPDSDPLQRDVDQISGIRPDNRSAIDERTIKTIACWQLINTARAAATPPQLPVIVRGVAQAAYNTRWTALIGPRQEREDAAGLWRAGNSDLRSMSRALDQANKAWYQAWKSEFPAGTPEGDALAGVDTEDGTAMPQVLEIAAVAQEGLSLRVTYVPGSGAHATVLDLLYQVEGATADYLRATANVAAGNLIGPFTAGQIVRVRTDVGNSRDHSEMSAEQVITIGPAV
jgi:hypothetical protein